ncbi:MAG: hypothetical protein IKB73_05890 [Ruminococcus sp.]|nr:hypothetical protein [Ruminococcus sp.]
MKKKILALLLIVILAFSLFGCGAKTLHCDNCKKEVTVKKNSNMEEDWSIYCEECNELLFNGEL